MLCIEMVLLTGTYRACSFEDRRRPEWPPHPARLFFAAVNAVHDKDPADADEVAALRWWEALGAPEISCSGVHVRPGQTVEQGWTTRHVLDHYVPGNFARSSTRDFNSHWDKIEGALVALESAAQSKDGKKITKAETALGKAVDKLHTDTVQKTQPTGAESSNVIADVVSLLPEQRNRQPRQFPVVTPDDPRVYFTWPGTAAADSHREVLDTILTRIARVGHSSCFVSCRTVLAPSAPAAWLPARSGPVSEFEPEVRTMAPGLYDALTAEFARHQGAAERVLPAVMTRYRRPGSRAGSAVRRTSMGDWIVLPLPAGARLPITRTQDVTRAVRGALMAHASQPVASVISGHPADPADTTALNGSHMAVLALPNVSHIHADGLIHAVAVCLPREVAADDRDAVFEALRNWSFDSGGEGHDLLLGGGRKRRLGAATLNAAVGERDWPPVSAPRTVVSREFWSRVARTWSSVTPVALDRHPRIGRRADCAEVSAAVAPIVIEMCRRVGLPSPSEVSASPVPVWASVPAVATSAGSPGRQRFPQFRTGGRSNNRRFTTNLSIRFAEPIGGPVVLGAGRFFGYGLMLPTPTAGVPELFGFEGNDDAQS